MKKRLKVLWVLCVMLGGEICSMNVANAAMYIPTTNTGTETTTPTTAVKLSTPSEETHTSTLSALSAWYDSWKHSGDVYDKYEWGFLGYVGIMTGAELYRDMYFNFEGLGPGMLYTFEVDRQLPRDNWARRTFAPLLLASTIELASNVTYETDPTGPLWEFNPYFVFRWRDFPWNHKLLTTFAIGEGVSWASHSPQQEIDSENTPGDASKFLNYIMTEITFSLPKHPEWQVLYRLHHRSGVFGLYCPGTVGSTAAGIGVRYWME